ncbi:MAG TPA: PIG-L family deacetylase [Longimicrobiales bacterium]|nr:PIG-L family deacetylase [Longimicrobiales bacterium]
MTGSADLDSARPAPRGADGSDLGSFPGPVLVLAPHMDDEALACGRLIAALSDAGCAVHVLFATDGARSPAVSPGRVPELVAARAAEARRAADVLGYGADRARFLGLPDGALGLHVADLTLGVARAWAAIRPSTVLAPSRYDRHPDHLTLRSAALACARTAPAGSSLWEYFVYYRWRLLPGGDLRRLVRPDLRVVPHTRAFAERKRRAIECYRSQTTLYAAGQRRPILPPRRVAEVSTGEELFVRFDPRTPGAGILGSGRSWVPVAHRVEPALKAGKERLKALVPHPPEWPAAPGSGAAAALGSGSDPAAAPDAGSGGDASPTTRVVVFASPFPLPAEWRFLARVDAHPDLELAGVLCLGSGTGRAARIADVWRRRGLLAAPLLLRDAGAALAASGAPPADAVKRIRPRIRVVPDVHAPEVLGWVASLDADVGVVYGGPILKPALFGIPKRGTLGVHHGRLPEYRGKKTVFWAIANGEDAAGVTIQAINAGLDTGRVVRRGEVPIGRRSYREVSRRVQALGIDLLLDALLAGEPHPEPGGTPREGPAVAAGAATSAPYRDPSIGDLLRLFLRRFRR